LISFPKHTYTNNISNVVFEKILVIRIPCKPNALSWVSISIDFMLP
jgi:hypothetical protein